MTSAVKISMKINVWINLFPLVKVWILQCGYMYHLHQWLVNNLDCNLLFYCIFSVVTVHMHLNSTCAMSINTLLRLYMIFDICLCQQCLGEFLSRWKPQLHLGFSLICSQILPNVHLGFHQAMKAQRTCFIF